MLLEAKILAVADVLEAMLHIGPTGLLWVQIRLSGKYQRIMTSSMILIW